MLQVLNVSKVFGGVKAVDSVSFTIGSGEILGLIGPNGSGKSTIINIISRLYRPTSGQVFFKGGLISDLPPYKVAKAGVSRTFQLLRLFQGLTAYENVLTATHLAGSHGLLHAVAGGFFTRHEEAHLRERAREALAFVGLSSRASVLAQRLTAGEGRLLELARAIAARTELILLDEPAAGLNSSETALLADKLRTLQSRGLSLLLVDHHMRLVMGLATRVVVINEGKLLAQGTPAEVQRDERVVAAYLGTGAMKRKVTRNV